MTFIFWLSAFDKIPQDFLGVDKCCRFSVVFGIIKEGSMN
jgi:hypothetical protein